MDIQIRPYHSTDKNALLHIFRDNIPKYFDPKEIHDFENYLETESETYHTIELGNKIVGGIGAVVNEARSTGSIAWIFFDPEHTGKGLGKFAVDYCITELKKNPAVKKLTVRTSQLVYVFFEKFGFKLIRTEKDYWGDGLDLYEMEVEC